MAARVISLCVGFALAATVVTPRHERMGAAARASTAEALGLAETLGGEAVTLHCESDPAAELFAYARRLVGHKQLLQTVWGAAYAQDTHYSRIIVGHIRDKLGGDAAEPRHIVTEPGVGYRLLGE